MRRWSAVFLAAVLIGCTAPSPVPGLKERYAGEAVANAALRDRILAATHAYWSALAAGRWREAYDYFTLDFQEKTPFTEWRRQRHETWTIRSQPVSILWSKAAHRSHGPELYAIVGWTAPAPAPALAGSLTWRQQPDGSFLLENSEADLLPAAPKT